MSGATFTGKNNVVFSRVLEASLRTTDFTALGATDKSKRTIVYLS